MMNPPASAGDNSSLREADTQFPCHICSLGFSSSTGLKRHIAGHNRNPTAHLAQPLNGTGFRCRDCSAFFNSQIGLSQHRRRAHPAEYNKEKLTRLHQSQYNWSKLEDSTLLNMASVLNCSGETEKQLYAKLVAIFPHRSAEAIKKRLQHLSRTAAQQLSAEYCSCTTSLVPKTHDLSPTTLTVTIPTHPTEPTLEPLDFWYSQ
ncbi:uncharacterized protein DEA37_0004846 [Paragonimus westermani]|uniref:C2H2-type domain-containing protein n=1 Tax=Paragonimus westermani TaxID=34504 RepID=A0A5J4N5F6_9TREM|nr:uncharacterized protein DEA37_0004846 [Paragonimus westermani]